MCRFHVLLFYVPNSSFESIIVRITSPGGTSKNLARTKAWVPAK
jgi:hypothetical protein